MLKSFSLYNMNNRLTLLTRTSDNITSITWKSYCNITEFLASAQLILRFHTQNHFFTVSFLYKKLIQSNIKLKDNQNGLV